MIRVEVRGQGDVSDSWGVPTQHKIRGQTGVIDRDRTLNYPIGLHIVLYLPTSCRSEYEPIYFLVSLVYSFIWQSVRQSSPLLMTSMKVRKGERTTPFHVLICLLSTEPPLLTVQNPSFRSTRKKSRRKSEVIHLQNVSSAQGESLVVFQSPISLESCPLGRKNHRQVDQGLRFSIDVKKLIDKES